MANTSPLTQSRIPRGRALLVVLLGFLVFAAVIAWADARAVTAEVRGFRWALMPAIIGLVLFNYALRFAKWQGFLRLAGVQGVPLSSSALIFLGGLGMTITPGKVGEWIKSYFLLSRHQVRVARTAPIVLAERLTDGFGLLVLASGGLLLVRQGWVLLLVLAILGAAGVAALQYRPLAQWAIGKAARLPVLRRYGGFLTDFHTQAARLLALKPLLLGSVLSAVSWAGEGLALYLVYVGLGAPNTWQLAVKGVFILSISTLAGLAALVPGGLAVTEGGMAGLSRGLVGLSREGAAAATLLARLSTLWFGVLLGSIALAFLYYRRGPRDFTTEHTESTEKNKTVLSEGESHGDGHKT